MRVGTQGKQLEYLSAWTPPALLAAQSRPLPTALRSNRASVASSPHQIIPCEGDDHSRLPTLCHCMGHCIHSLGTACRGGDKGAHRKCYARKLHRKGDDGRGWGGGRGAEEGGVPDLVCL